MNALRIVPLIALVALPARGATPTVNQRTFTVPDGFEVTLAASSDRVPRPVSASLDDHGNLYVTDSSGSNEAPAEQLKHPNHRLLRLEDTDGDGVYDRTVVFAEQVMFPQGCLWYDGSVYVAAPPSIWKFTDTDGDGKADRREEWFKGGSLTGCANDIHGPYLGPDGYIYWTKGAFAEQTHPLGNGRVLKDKAAHIYRARPDGSDLDVVMSGGMDNPVEITFTPDGETLFSSTFIDFTQPGFRDGVAHAIYGGVYGKVNDVLDDGRVTRTGPDLFHPFFEAGPAAECGLTRYESAAFGVDYRDNLFATTFNLHKVTRHILRPSGATYASTDSDFLVSDHPDFHPTDVLEDADGSLLVVDTGGWYRLCCPSSQLAKPDVLGAVYRIRRTGAPRPKDLWNGIAARIPQQANSGGIDQAAGLLASDPPQLRAAAVQWLVKSGAPALPALRKAALEGSSWRQRQEAVWAAFRIGTPAASALFVEALDHPDPGLRRAAAKALSLRPDPASEARLLKLAASDDAALVRSAAEGLGRLRSRSAVPVLLAKTSKADDAFLEHSLIYALIQIAAPEETRAGLSAPSMETRRAALIALDQMEGGGLKATDVVPFLNVPDESLRGAADWILGRHPAWGAELADWFRARLVGPGLSADARTSLESQMGILTQDARGQELLADAVMLPGFPGSTRLAALRAMAGAGLKEPPTRWRDSVLVVLHGNGPEVATAVTTAKSLNADPAVVSALLALSRDTARPAELRLGALAALPGGVALDPGDVAFLRTQLDGSLAPAVRAKAAGVLGRAKLDPASLQVMAADLKAAGPLELNLLLQAYDAGGDEALGRNLLAALQESKSARALHPTQLKPHFAKFPDPVKVESETFIASLNADAAQQAHRLDALLEELKAANGDLRRGQTVFNGSKAACSTCHRIGYLGGNVGPELTKIGEVRSERDLLESIVYPSLSFVRSYEPSRVTLKGGDEINGIVRRETPEEITLVTGPGAEQRIRREEIAEIQPGVISVMPGGLDGQLSRQELADLLVFVKTVRWR
ncbi:MAG: PVC-type heme-binding CxxCH protein [Verrucomicrobiota bacterium]